MNEAPEDRIKRMRMRSWRRGTKEMDMILGPYSDRELANLEGPLMDDYDALLHENDQDLYQWISGQSPEPARFSPILDLVRAFLAQK